MRANKTIIFFLLIYSTTILGGTDSLAVKDTLPVKKIVFNTSVFEYFPTLLLHTGNLNLGSEIYLGKNNSVYINAGYITSYGESSGIISILAIKTTGYKIQMEGKHYLRKHKVVQPAMLLFWPHIFQFHSQKLENTGFYASVHSFFQSTETLRPQSFVYEAYGPNKPRIMVNNSYVVTRRAAALHLKFGYNCIKASGVNIDYAVGIGAQFIYSESVGKSPLGTVWSESQGEYGQKAFDEGFLIRPSFVYQVKIGFGY